MASRHMIDQNLLFVFFKQNLYMLMELLKVGAFGELQAWLYSIEFQKRGLSHAHLQLWLKRKCKIPLNAIATVVFAEIPDRIIVSSVHHCYSDSHQTRSVVNNKQEKKQVQNLDSHSTGSKVNKIPQQTGPS